jgi:hypothetical protein
MQVLAGANGARFSEARELARVLHFARQQSCFDPLLQMRVSPPSLPSSMPLSLPASLPLSLPASPSLNAAAAEEAATAAVEVREAAVAEVVAEARVSCACVWCRVSASRGVHMSVWTAMDRVLLLTISTK